MGGVTTGRFARVNLNGPAFCGVATIEVLACDDCGALVTKDTAQKHAEWHLGVRFVSFTGRQQ